MTTRPTLIVLLVVLLTGCAAGEQDATTAPAAAGTTPSSASSAPATASASPTPAPTPAVRTIDVSYAAGEVSGTTGREDVALGEQVVLRITSDVADQVHVHGYDLEQDLPAGVPVEIPLTASIPGGFEVELHDAGRALFQLRVS